MTSTPNEDLSFLPPVKTAFGRPNPALVHLGGVAFTQTAGGGLTPYLNMVTEMAQGLPKDASAQSVGARPEPPPTILTGAIKPTPR